MRKAKVKNTTFDIHPDKPLEMHERFPFFAYNMVLNPKMIECTDAKGKRFLTIMGISDKVEPEDNFMFYTIMLATRLSEGLDLSQFDRIQYLDMVQKGFNEQYPDNGSGREDFTFGKVGLPDDLKFDVDVTFLDLEDPDRRTDYVNVNIPRASPERFGKTDGMETDETEQASSDPVFGWEYGEREGAYLNDIEEAWALFSKGSLNKKGVRPS